MDQYLALKMAAEAASAAQFAIHARNQTGAYALAAAMPQAGPAVSAAPTQYNVYSQLSAQLKNAGNSAAPTSFPPQYTPTSQPSALNKMVFQFAPQQAPGLLPAHATGQLAAQQQLAFQQQVAYHQQLIQQQMAIQHSQQQQLHLQQQQPTPPLVHSGKVGPNPHITPATCTLTSGARAHMENGEWAMWVLEMKVRDRNMLAEARNFTSKEMAELKAETKRHQHTKAQKRYHKKRAMAAGKSYRRPGRPRIRGVADEPRISQEEITFRPRKKKKEPSPEKTLSTLITLASAAAAAAASDGDGDGAESGSCGDDTGGSPVESGDGDDSGGGGGASVD